MKIKILKFNGDEQISSANKVELRKNQVAGWVRLNNDDVIDIKDIATIQICDDSDSPYKELETKVRADVVVEFAELLIKRCWSKMGDLEYVSEEEINEIKEQLKGAGEMTLDEAKKLLSIERECIDRNNEFHILCDRDCAKCDLVQETPTLLDMYDHVIEWLEELKKLRAEVAELHNERQAEFAMMREHDKQIKVDAVDEFVSKCKERIEEICLKAEDDIPFLDIFDIENIAKQMKGG